VYAKARSNGYLKLYYNHPVWSQKNNYYYLFGGLSSSRLTQNTDFRLGFGYINANSNIESRLKVDIKEHPQLTLYFKTHLAYLKARFGLISVIGLNQGVVQKNNLLFGYHFTPNFVGMLRAKVNGFRS
jgi:hypothetical protein